MGEVALLVAADAATNLLDDLAGDTGLALSFYALGPNAVNQGPSTVSLREAGGVLRLLAYRKFDDATLLAGEAADVARAPWLERDATEYTEWNLPFGDMQVVDTGCDNRTGDESVEYADVYKPLALVFDSDDNEVTIFHGNAVSGVVVNGQHYEVTLESAFIRIESGCVDCPEAEVALLIIRSN